MLRNRLFGEWLLLCVGACLLAVWSIHSGITDRIDTRLLDSSAALIGAEPSPDIAIARIDEASLEALGAWPWPRRTHALLIDRLTEAGAKQIVYDVLFMEPTNPEDDARLAGAIERAGNVVLPHTFGVVSDAGDVGAQYPLPMFAERASALGHVSATADADGVLRRFALELGDQEETYPLLTVAAFRALGEVDDPSAIAREAGQSNWPIVPFVEPGAFATIPVSQVVDGTILDGSLSGKVVLVGATAQGMGDRYPVAAGAVTLMPGVEAQANLLNTLMNGAFVREAGLSWTVALTCLVILLQFLAFWQMQPKAHLLATIILFVAVLCIAIAAVPLGLIWVAPATALTALILAYPLWSWRRLTSVSNFLEVQALKLGEHSDAEAGASGFDVIARQVGRMRSLVQNVNSSFEFLGQIIEAAPDPILVVKRDGAIDMWNSKAAQLFPDWELSDGPTFAELFATERVSVDHGANEVSTADGRTFLMARGALIGGDEGDNTSGDIAPDGAVIALRDISQIRRQETERREMLEFLSHDMRTPQVAIVGLTQKAAGSINEDHRLQRIQVQAERTLKLADDFVQLARLEESDLVFEETDLVSLIQESCDRAFVAARKNGITIDQPDLEDPIFASVEASLIARLLDNLIGNAIKFSPKGSVVAIHVAPAEDGKVVLEVSDNGPGLSPERQADPFARFGAHDNRAGPSVGLGLTFVQRAVLKHRGHIDVESDPESGTKFRIVLPEFQI